MSTRGLESLASQEVTNSSTSTEDPALDVHTSMAPEDSHNASSDEVDPACTGSVLALCIQSSQSEDVSEDQDATDDGISDALDDSGDSDSDSDRDCENSDSNGTVNDSVDSRGSSSDSLHRSTSTPSPSQDAREPRAHWMELHFDGGSRGNPGYLS